MKANHGSPTESGAAKAPDMFRDNDYLIVRTKRPLTGQCFACNATATRRMRFRLWESGDITRNVVIWFVFGWMIGFFVLKRVTLKIPLCDEHYRRESWYRTRVNGMLLAAIGFMVFSIYVSIYHESASDFADTLGFPLSMLMLVFALVVRIRHPRLFTAPKIAPPFIWLANVSPDLLSTCPRVEKDSPSVQRPASTN